MKLLCAFLLILIIVSVCQGFVLGRGPVRRLQRLKRELQVEDEGRSCHGRYCQKYKPDRVAPRINTINNRFNAEDDVKPDTHKRCHGSYCQ